MEELVGNTDGFADSGYALGIIVSRLLADVLYRVSSAVVQRYMSFILDSALSQHAQNQAIATDILSFTIKQGLAHPLQV